MARGRKSGPTRLDKRREAEAVEARGKDDGEEIDEVEEADADADEGDADDEDGAKKKKPAKKVKAKAAPKKPAAKRVRTPKEEKHRAVWVVFDNASKRVETFPFSQKAEADALLARKQEEKKGTFYINLVKDKME